MKDIDKLIRHYVLEIVFTIVLVIVSIPVWNMFNNDDSANIAKSYATMDYLYLDVNKYVGTKESKDIVSVVNNTNTERGYNLVLKLKKDNVDDNTIVTVNNEQYSLNDLDKETDKNYTYYSIKTGTLVANKECVTVEYKNTTIDYSDVEYQIIENHEV